MKTRIIGQWSVRPFPTSQGDTAFRIYPKGTRDFWSCRATLWPASDGHSFVIDMPSQRLDARASLDEALDYVIGRLKGDLLWANGTIGTGCGRLETSTARQTAAPVQRAVS